MSSITRGLTLGFPSIDNAGNPDEVLVNTTRKIVATADNLKGKTLHQEITVQSPRANVLYVHDLDHASSGTIPLVKHMPAFTAEAMVGAFHQAVDSFQEEMQQSLRKTSDKTTLGKASFYTTKETDPNTLGSFAAHMGKMVALYQQQLKEHPDLVKTILAINHTNQGLFEQFALNGKEGDTFGFSMTPVAFKELRTIHTTVLNQFKAYIEQTVGLENSGFSVKSFQQLVPTDFWGTIGAFQPEIDALRETTRNTKQRFVTVLREQWESVVKTSIRRFSKR